MPSPHLARTAFTGLTTLTVLLPARVSGATLAPEVVSLYHLSFVDRDGAVAVHAEVHNLGADRVFVYESPRRLLWDGASRTMVLVMHSVPVPTARPAAGCHAAMPKFRGIDPGATLEVDVVVPRNVPWLHDGAPTTVTSAPEHVRVELGWTDGPPALEPETGALCEVELDTRLKALERGVLVQLSP